MSWKAVRWAGTWPGELTSQEAFVLHMLAQAFNEKELRAWPSVATLVEQTRLSKSSVVRALNGLEEAGLIEKETWLSSTGKRLTTRYCLPWYNPQSVSKPGGCVVDQYFNPAGDWETHDAPYAAETYF